LEQIKKKVIMKKGLLHTVLLPLLSLVFLFLSCTKESKQPATTYNLQGLWVGSIKSATTIDQPYSLSIKSDGTLLFHGIANNVHHFGTGTWVLAGSTLTCNVTTTCGVSFNVGVQQRLTAEFNSTTGVLSSGTWTNTNASANSGTFQLTEVN
jgi:hypothetical protein